MTDAGRMLRSALHGFSLLELTDTITGADPFE